MSVSDSVTFTTSLPRIAPLVVTASDGFSSETLKYNIEIQNPVLDVLLTTTPLDLTNIANDGCIIYAPFSNF